MYTYHSITTSLILLAASMMHMQLHEGLRVYTLCGMLCHTSDAAVDIQYHQCYATSVVVEYIAG